jgi:hypothetical protein
VGIDMDKVELEQFIENHDVVYIRHLMASNKEAYQSLISKRIAAIHYGECIKKGVDKTVLENHLLLDNYEESSTGQRALNRLIGYCKTGAIVVADYSSPYYTNSKTGIEKTITIGILRGDKNMRPKVERYEPEPDDRKQNEDGLFYKQVTLDEVIELRGADLAMMLAIQPRGNTVIHWEEGENAIKFIYRREKKLKLNIESIGYRELFPAQQEVLCSEYLRSESAGDIRVKYLLLPVGRGMKSIDICGSGERKLVFAQVSFTDKKDEIKEKLKALNDAAKRGTTKVYFGPKSARQKVREISTDLQFISMETVTEVMKNSGIFEDMLGIAT